MVNRAKLPNGKLVNGKITISDTTNLKEGDEVVVVQPMHKPVYSSRTGKRLGMGEKIIGRGKIVKADNQLVVQMVHPSEIKRESVQSHIKEQNVSHGYVRYKTTMARPSIKGRDATKNTPSDVLIKVVNSID